MSEKSETGKTGEAVACAYLKTGKYTILHTNWRFHHYELDIVATDGRELVVVEVKTRSENCLIAPEQTIDAPKIQRLVTATEEYIRLFDVQTPVRFDVICLTKKGRSYIVDRHIEDAFFAPLK
jgi:putative endonuclease